MSDLDKKQLKAIEDYLRDRQILVVDAATSSRSSVSRLLTELGASSTCLSSSPAFDQAVEEITKNKPSMIVSEYTIGDRSGMELIKAQKEIFPKEEERLFILATGNSSETAVAEAAEEDVDGFIIKPFTAQTLKEGITKAILRKVNPSDYLVKIREGKDDLEGKSLEDAEKKFTEAKGMDKAPTLAIFYEGKTVEEKGDTDAAAKAYDEGLTHNKIHYKCLVGSFEAYDKLENRDQAYERVRQIVEHFPVSPQRLGKMFWLAVHTRNFGDVNKYYEAFSKMEHRPDDLIKTISAGLVVCARFMLKQKKNEEGMESLQRALTASRRNPKIIFEIIRTLTKNQFFEEAKDYLAEVEAEDQADNTFKVLQTVVQSGVGEFPEAVKAAQALLGEGVQDYELHQAMVRALVGLKDAKNAKEAAEVAASQHMDKREDFFKLLEELPEQEEALGDDEEWDEEDDAS